MTDVRTVIFCAQCQTFWSRGTEPATCTDADHEHHAHEVHCHRTVVDLPGGVAITAVSFDADDPYAREQPPTYGLYLDPRWRPPWPHDHVDWPDFGVPTDPASVAEALRPLLARAAAGERVEIGCLGGHGRTGTALACLAVLSGAPADGAVAWVRAAYCADAVETPEQEAFVAGFAG